MQDLKLSQVIPYTYYLNPPNLSTQQANRRNPMDQPHKKTPSSPHPSIPPNQHPYTLLPAPQELLRLPSIPLQNLHMFPTSRQKPHLERQRPRRQIVLKRLSINLKPLPRYLIHFMPYFECPQHPRKYTPLRPFRELYTSADAATRPIRIVIPLLVISRSCIIRGQQRRVAETIGIVRLAVRVLRAS